VLTETSTQIAHKLFCVRSYVDQNNSLISPCDRAGIYAITHDPLDHRVCPVNGISATLCLDCAPGRLALTDALPSGVSPRSSKVQPRWSRLTLRRHRRPYRVSTTSRVIRVGSILFKRLLTEICDKPLYSPICSLHSASAVGGGGRVTSSLPPDGKGWDNELESKLWGESIGLTDATS
jgi:hypothetical protein